jgi:hypothetical protein
VTIDTDANQVNLYLAGAPQSIVNQIQAAHPGLYVIHPAEYTWDEVMSLMNTVSADKSLEASGIYVRGLGPTQDGRLEIDIQAKDMKKATAELESKYGSDRIRVTVAVPAASAVGSFRLRK